MTDKAFISDLTWRDRRYQLKEILAAMGNPDPDTVKIYEGQEDVSALFRPSRRNGRDMIYVSSLACIADNEADFRKFINLARLKKAEIYVAEKRTTYGCSAGSMMIEDWRDARKDSAAKIGGRISGDRKEAATKKAIELIRDDWRKPSAHFSTEELKKRSGLSLNTIKKHLGRRPIAQANYLAAQRRKIRKLSAEDANA